MDKNNEYARFLTALNRIFVFIRFKPEPSYNIKILDLINKYIDARLTGYDMFQADLIITLESDLDFGKEEVDYKDMFISSLAVKDVRTDNIEEIEKFIVVIKKCAIELKGLLLKKSSEQASELADAVHGLPEALLFKKNLNAKTFWRTYFKPYRERWDKSFLKDEEIIFGKPSFIERFTG